MSLNIQNLRVPTSEEAREIGRKGGKASAKKRKERKEWKETMTGLLQLTMQPGAPDSIQPTDSLMTIKGKNLTVQEAIGLAVIKRAMSADMRAVEFIKEVVEPNQNSPENIASEINNNIRNIAELLNNPVEDRDADD